MNVLVLLETFVPKKHFLKLTVRRADECVVDVTLHQEVQTEVPPQTERHGVVISRVVLR